MNNDMTHQPWSTCQCIHRMMMTTHKILIGEIEAIHNLWEFVCVQNRTVQADDLEMVYETQFAKTKYYESNHLTTAK